MVRKLLVIVPLAFVGCTNDTDPSPSMKDNFATIQSEVFDKSCIQCHHGGISTSALLSLQRDSSYRVITTKRSEISTRFPRLIVPGQPDSSFLYRKLTGDILQLEGEQMPQRQAKLPEHQIAAIRSWIAKGAPND